MPVEDGYIHFLPNCASLQDAGFIIFYRTVHLCKIPVPCSSAEASQQHKPAEASKSSTYMPEKQHLKQSINSLAEN
jgi:hypothetical protein